jgi:hypothetical protein
MRMVAALAVAAACAAVGNGCTVEPPPGADSGADPGDDGGGPGEDGATGQAGLILEFRSTPPVPADLGGEWDAELEEVRFDLRNVRAVGDAAPGDERTSREELRLDWRDGEDDDGRSDPVQVVFNQAPPGLYSYVLAQVDDYRISGTCEVTDSEYDYDIDDQPSSLDITIELGGLNLEPGTTRTVVIDVSVASAVVDTDWAAVEPEDGELEIDHESDQIEAIRQRVVAGFSAELAEAE